MLFARKPKRYEAEKTDQKLLELTKKKVRYVVIRDSRQNTQTIIGKSGYINFSEGRIIISCEERVVFNMPLEEISICELLSKDGATFHIPIKKQIKNLP